jgi:hypothetical protein
LVGLAIVQKQGRALGIERLGNQLDQVRELMVERKLLGDRVADLDQDREAPDLLDQLLDRGIGGAVLDCVCQRPLAYRSGPVRIATTG